MQRCIIVECMGWVWLQVLEYMWNKLWVTKIVLEEDTVNVQRRIIVEYIGWVGLQVMAYVRLC